MKKIIEDNLLSIANTIINSRSRKDWQYVTDEQKEKWHFMINRYFSKIYPEKSQLLNYKNIDKVSSMNLWFHFMENETYPKDFWSKSQKSDSSLISNKDFKLLLEKLKIKDLDLIYLVNNHLDIVKSELKYYKDIEKL